MIRVSTLISAGMALPLLVGCGLRSSNNSDVKAPQAIGESFLIEKTKWSDSQPANTLRLDLSPAASSGNASPQDAKSRFRVGIYKKSLEKEFLFLGSMITQAPIASFQGMKSRVVAFKKVDQTLFMLEATDGHTVSHSLEQKLVLAGFPIQHETEDLIYFDFSKGLNKIYHSGDWYASDYDKNYQDTWSFVEFDLSFIDKASLANNELSISQVGTFSMSQNGSRSMVPVELRYHLSPYKENSAFKPTVSDSFDHYGFFEVAPKLRTQGPELIHASKFDHTNGITFGISANTPKEYQQAVIDGVLYWNKAFGKEVLKAEILPKGVQAPDYRHNIVQWVDWEDAGFAYADAQMDPRTGEIKNAQVYMTSAFALGGRIQARRMLARLHSQLLTTPVHGHDHDIESVKKSMQQQNIKPLFALGGFLKEPMCDFKPSREFMHSLEAILASFEDSDDKKIHKIASDYIREVVAHEVGHTLGLRHNFAGSLHANFPQSTKASIFADYLKNGRAPEGVVTSSSVMEYQLFEEGAITGDQVARPGPALDYDQKVIEKLYFGQSHRTEDLPLFCTDSHVAIFADCNRFDSGASLVEHESYNLKKSLDALPYTLMERFIAAKSPYSGYEPTPLKMAVPNPAAIAMTLMMPRFAAIKHLDSNTKLLSVRREFGPYNQFEQYEVIAQEQAKIEEEFRKHQVFDNLLQDVYDFDLQKAQDKFNALLESDHYRRGVGPGGQSYEFSYADLEVMKNQSQLFFSALKFTLLPMDLMILGFAKNVVANDMGQKLLDKYDELANEIVLSVSGEKEVEVDSSEGGTIITLPQFKYSTGLRVRAAGLLKSKWENPVWAASQKRILKNKLTEKLNKPFGEGAKFITLHIGDYPIEVAEFIHANKQVLAGF